MSHSAKRGKPGRKPGGDRERAMRLAKTEKMLAAHVSRSEIERIISAEFNVSDRQVRRDFMTIYAKWDADSVEERPARRNQLRQTIRKVIQKALADGDGKLVLAAIDRLAALDGLNAPDRSEVNVTGKMVALSEMTTEEKRREFERLIGIANANRANGKRPPGDAPN